MPIPEPIPAGPVLLRRPVPEDADAITRACADPEIARFLPEIPAPYSRGDALEWITSISPADWAAGGASFVIAERATGEPLGTIRLGPPDRAGNREAGYWLAPWARGRGYATTALRALAERAFAAGVPRVWLHAEVENIPSQLVAHRAGFRLEGVLRGAQRARDGSRRDVAAFARLATDPGDPVRPYLPFLPGGYPGGELTDGVVRLTPLTAADTAAYHELMSLPDVVRHHLSPEPPTRAESAERCRYAGHRWLSGERADLAIRDAASGAFAGHIELTAIVPALGEAMVGYCVHPAFRGRGFATRALRLLVGWAFRDTPIARIVAGTDPANTPSHRVLERAGFTREGVARGLLPGPDGARHDDLRWARLR